MRQSLSNVRVPDTDSGQDQSLEDLRSIRTCHRSGGAGTQRYKFTVEDKAGDYWVKRR